MQIDQDMVRIQLPSNPAKIPFSLDAPNGRTIFIGQSPVAMLVRITSMNPAKAKLILTLKSGGKSKDCELTGLGEIVVSAIEEIVLTPKDGTVEGYALVVA